MYFLYCMSSIKSHLGVTTEGGPPGPGWTFLSNHGHVLVCLARDPGVRVRDMAARVGISERAVLRILGELVTDGYVRRTREGRRNRYAIRTDRPLRHPLEAHRRVADLVAAVGAPESTDTPRIAASPAPRARSRRRRRTSGARSERS
jgi:DNA-binding transcriptional ArsR family regulator